MADELTELTLEQQERHRRRDNLPALPRSYDPILRLAGLDRTVRFARLFGGQKVTFPANPAPGNRVVRILGRQVVAVLAAYYGGEKVKFASALDYLTMLDAREMARRGWLIVNIARRLNRDPATIARYVRGVTSEKKPPNAPAAPPQATSVYALPLFAWTRRSH